MAKERDRSIDWCEKKIMRIMNRRHEISSYLAMSSLVLQNVRSTEEQHNLDTAIGRLIVRGCIRVIRDDKGFRCYRLVRGKGK